MYQPIGNLYFLWPNNTGVLAENKPDTAGAALKDKEPVEFLHLLGYESCNLSYSATENQDPVLLSGAAVGLML